MLGTYLAVVRRRLLLLVVLTLVIAPLAFFGLTRSGPVYTSEAILQVEAGNVAEEVFGQSRAYEEPERRVATELELLQSPAVAEEAAAQLRRSGWDISAVQAARHIEAAPRGLSSFIEVLGSDARPDRAQRLTDEIVSAYLDNRSNARRTELLRLQTELRTRLQAADQDLAALEGADNADLRAREAAVARYQNVADLLEAVGLRLSVDTPGVRLVSDADRPIDPSGLSRPLAAAASLLGALFLAAGIVLVLDVLRDAVRTPAEAAALTGAPVLLEAPRLGADRSRWALAITDPTHPTGAAAWLLRLRLLGARNGTFPSPVLLAGSPGEPAGSTLETAVAMAAACAGAGSRVLLVADDDEPGFPFGSAEEHADDPSYATACEPGLPFGSAEERADDPPYATACEPGWPATPGSVTASPSRPLPRAGWTSASAARPSPATLPRVAWLRATAAPDGRRGLLDAASPQAALDELGADYDVILLAVPAGGLVDGMAVRHLAEAMLIVVSLGRSRGRLLRQLATTLAQSGTAVDGLAVLGVRCPQAGRPPRGADPRRQEALPRAGGAPSGSWGPRHASARSS